MPLVSKRHAQFVIFCVLCLSGIPAISAPYNGDIIELKQPDGTKTEVRFYGDEYYCRGESLDGYTVMRDKQSGWIVYAVLNDAGTEFVPTDVVYDHRIPTNPEDTVFPNRLNAQSRISTNAMRQPGQNNPALKKQLRLNRDAIMEKRRKRAKEIENPRPDTVTTSLFASGLAGDSLEGTTETAPAPLIGSVVGLTILVKFQDTPASELIPVSQVEDYCNQPGYSLDGNNGSVRDFYYGISGGKLEYTNIVTDYILLDHDQSYYDDCDGGKTSELIDEAMNELCDQGFDFSVLTKSEGWIQATNIFYAGTRNCGWPDGLWPHKGSKWSWYSCSGTGVGNYQITDMGSSLKLGTFCHENGHMLCDWPDLYDYGSESNGAGSYDLMAYGGPNTNPVPPNPYFRSIRGWETYIDITNAPADSFYSILANPFNDPSQELITFKYSNPNNSKEYFLIENCYKIGRRSGMPDAGLLIWHIDEDGSNNNEQMTPTSHYKVSVEQADGRFQLENNDGYGGSGDLFHAGDKDEFTDFTLPDATWWDTSNSKLVITNISTAGSEMTFVKGSPPDFTISPRYLSYFTIAYEGTTSDSLVFTVNNNASHTINWTATTGDANWYDLSAYSGTINPQNSSTVDVILNAETQNLPVGTHQDTIVFTNTTDNTVVERTVTIQVYPRQKIAYWALDETTGTTASDISNHGHDGTVVNTDFAAASVTGQVGTALQFDGSNDHIVVPGFTEDISGLTLSAWIKADDWNGNRRILQKGGDGSEYRLLAEGGKFVFEMGSTRLQLASLPPTGTWVHIAAVYDGSTMSLYYNKVLKGSIARTGMVPTSSSDLYIGTKNAGAPSGDRFKGVMDEVRLYNYAMDADGLEALYNGEDTAEATNPYDGDINVALFTNLEWTMGYGAVSNDVYFGLTYYDVFNADTNSSKYKGRQSNTTFALNKLKRYTPYFWRIDQVDASGNITTGQVWQFTTGFGNGAISRQVWTGLGTSNYLTSLTQAANYPDNPSSETQLLTFKIPSDQGDGYGTRVHGFFISPVSGDYRFWISGDDEVELWLSSDRDPANVSLIAYVHGASTSEENFDQFSSQTSALITLQANRPYYIMALHKEGGGRDHMAVAFSGPGIDRQVIPGDYLMPYADDYDWGPIFMSRDLYGTDALEGYAYQDTVAGTATAMDGSDVSYSKAAGPLWLQVAADGTLSGIPGDGDVGRNNFDIRATDADGNSSTVSLDINIENTFTGEQGLEDFVELAAHWINLNCEDPLCDGADLTGDTTVDMDDLASMAAMWLIENPYGTLIANWSFDTDASDSISNNDGTLMNGAAITQTDGEFVMGSGALSLDGVDDYVEITDFKGITGTSSRTCTAWIKTDTTGAIMSWGSSTPSGGDYWYMLVNYSSSGNPGALHVSVSGGNVVGTTDLRDGQWHHIAVVLNDDGSPDSSELLLYVDGQSETLSYLTSQAINTTADSDVYIGSRFGSTSNLFTGIMDGVQIYDRALTELEVNSLIASKQLYLNLDETSGATASDASPYQRNALLINNPVWQPTDGVSNGALALDGTDDYIEIPGYKGVTGTSSRTCGMWIKTDTTGAIMSWGSSTPSGGDYWYMLVNYSSSGNPGALHVSVSGGNVVGTTDLRDGQWHHIAVVLNDDGSPDSSELLLYVDGQSETLSYLTSQAINTTADSDVYIGSRFGSTSNLFTGMIDEVQIYNQALSESEIATMAQK